MSRSRTQPSVHESSRSAGNTAGYGSPWSCHHTHSASRLLNNVRAGLYGSESLWGCVSLWGRASHWGWASLWGCVSQQVFECVISYRRVIHCWAGPLFPPSLRTGLNIEDGRSGHGCRLRSGISPLRSNPNNTNWIIFIPTAYNAKCVARKHKDLAFVCGLDTDWDHQLLLGLYSFTAAMHFSGQDSMVKDLVGWLLCEDPTSQDWSSFVWPHHSVRHYTHSTTAVIASQNGRDVPIPKYSQIPYQHFPDTNATDS